MRESKTKNKLVGVFGVLFGILCVLPVVIFDSGKFIIDDSPYFFVKYFIVITFINSGLYFIVFGILNYLGVIVPYFEKSINEYERAINHIISIVLSVPIWLCASLSVFVASQNTKWKVILGVVLLCILWLLFSSVQEIRKRKA